MDKLKMHSPNLTDENVAKIRDLFPGCVTEAADESGEVHFTVNFDQLRQELSEYVVEGPQERFQFNWPGKRQSLITANAPIAKTLRPSRDDSVSFDSTKNILIEGDNLEALKLLQETYLGKIKLIYIDPPYNTGNDFVYVDKFSEDADEFLIRSNQKSESGDSLVANTESNGRFHSDWLSMMYSRLRLSRNLLADDGVIFISIDAHEVHRLQSVCDEIFGESCHKNTISVRRGIKNVQAQFEDVSALSQGHEYILMYVKNKEARLPKLIWSHGERKPGKWDTFWRGTDRPTMRYELLGVKPESGQWRWEKSRTEEAIKNYEEYLSNHSPVMSLDEWYLDNFTSANQKLNFVRKSADGTIQYYVPPSDGKLLSDNWMDITISGNETKEFDTEKSVDLLDRIISWICGGDPKAIVLDFFAGSGTTAHAVMRQNAVDGGNRRFILVQLDAKVVEKSEAYKSGFKTISAITKQRIKTSGTKVIEGECAEGWDKDIGFRFLKLDTSNMQDVFYRPDEVGQADLLTAVDNIKPDRTPEDLLFQVLVDWGVDLTLPIRRETIHGKTVFFVDDNALAACFDSGVTEELVKDLASHEPLRAVFRDTGFVSDAVKINVEQIFRQLSPVTDIKSI